MEEAKEEKFEKKRKEKMEEDLDVDDFDTEGMDGYDNSDSEPSKKDRKDKREKPDGFEDLPEKDESDDWGKKERKKGNMTDEEKAEYAEPTEGGYGQPSKGTYSADLGGFKSYGTDGQGNSSVGAKDDLEDTCTDRVVLLTVVALNNTTEGDSDTTVTVTSAHGHPLVRSDAESYITFEIMQAEFLSDASFGLEDGGAALKVAASIVSLVTVAMLA